MRLLPLLLAALLLYPAKTASAEPSAALRLSGPPLVESPPLLTMAHADRPWEQDFEVRFLPWRSPDMLRAMVAGGQTDGAILTTAAACILCSRGLPCRVAALLEPPLRIVSTPPGPDTLASLTGTLLFPFGPGEMPERLYQAVGGVADGMQSVDRQLLEMARVYRLPLRLLRIHAMAEAGPLLSGMVIATGNTIRTVVLAEMLGADEGLGNALTIAQTNLRTDDLYALTLLAMLVIGGVEAAFLRPVGKALRRRRQA